MLSEQHLQVCNWNKPSLFIAIHRWYILYCYVSLQLYIFIYLFQARLQWARQRVRHNLRYWRRIRVHFSDQSLFELGKVDGRVRVWRRRNEAHKADCILPTRWSGRVTIQVWGCVSYDCKLPLLRVQGRLTGQRYRDEVLAAAVDPHLDTHPLRGPRDRPLFQQDNAPVHTARVCRDFLRTNSIDVMPWPSRSPNLNIIENVWSYIGARVNEMDVAPNTADELWIAIQGAWNDMPPEVVRRLVRSCRRRCVAVIEVAGGPTKY